MLRKTKRAIYLHKQRKNAKNNLILKGQKIVCFGDSIWNLEVGNGKVSDILKSLLGGCWLNFAVAGSRLTATAKDNINNSYSMNVIKGHSEEFYDADYIVIAYGSNDFANGVNSEIYLDQLKEDVIYLRHNSKAKIIIVSTLRYIQCYKWDKNLEGIEAFNDAVKEWSLKNGCGFVDMLHAMPLDETNRKVFTDDGIHLSYLGHSVYANIFAMNFISMM